MDESTRSPRSRRRRRRRRRSSVDNDAPLAIAANDGGVLPTDLLREVLLRLPAVDLCRLRLVCRPWRSLTSEPTFAAAHASRHPPHAAAFDSHRREVHVLDLAAGGGNIVKRIRLEQIGIPLVSGLYLQCLSDGWWQAFVLGGGVPTRDITTNIAVDFEHEIRFGPTAARYVLGHVPSTGEYKVLCIRNSHDHGGYHHLEFQTCEVVTLGGSDKGRRARPGPQAARVALEPWLKAVVAGIAYFLIEKALDDTVDLDCIASFDMAAEVWRPMTLHGPQIAGLGRSGDYWLAGLNNSLVAVRCEDHDWSMDLWKLVDMEKSLWIKQYSMQGQRVPSCERWGLILPLVVLDDGRIVFWMLIARLLTTYDPRTGSWANPARVGNYLSLTMHHGSLLC